MPDRDLQTHGHRTARLPRRRHHKDRQRPLEQPNRRSAAMGLSRCPATPGRGLKTTLTQYQYFEADYLRRPIYGACPRYCYAAGGLRGLEAWDGPI